MDPACDAAGPPHSCLYWPHHNGNQMALFQWKLECDTASQPCACASELQSAHCHMRGCPCMQNLAVALQNRMSEVLHVDIHPGAAIGQGVLIDHATGVVSILLFCALSFLEALRSEGPPPARCAMLPALPGERRGLCYHAAWPASVVQLGQRFPHDGSQFSPFLCLHRSWARRQ